MSGTRNFSLAVMLVFFVVPHAFAVEPGKAAGMMTFDSSTTTLVFAALSSKENSFDSSKQDTIVVLTDRALGDTAADDDVELAQRADRGELVVLTLPPTLTQRQLRACWCRRSCKRMCIRPWN